MNRPKDEFKKRYALKSGENLQHGQDENLKLMPFQVSSTLFAFLPALN